MSFCDLVNVWDTNKWISSIVVVNHLLIAIWYCSAFCQVSSTQSFLLLETLALTKDCNPPPHRLLHLLRVGLQSISTAISSNSNEGDKNTLLPWANSWIQIMYHHSRWFHERLYFLVFWEAHWRFWQEMPISTFCPLSKYCCKWVLLLSLWHVWQLWIGHRYNHGHNILKLFYVLPNFAFTTSEKMHNYYL